MPLVCSIDESRDRIAVIDPDSGEVILWADVVQAQTMLKQGKVEAIRRKGKIRCLAVIAEKRSSLPEKPTPLRSPGAGDSHNKIRQCTCEECKENGAPIQRHLYRSTNPPKVWTIDYLPRSGAGDWRTKALFRRPILECIYGKLKVDQGLNPAPKLKTAKLLQFPKAA